jgi:hypothetical protein
MADQDDGITLKVVLDQMQSMHNVVLQEIRRLDVKIDQVEKRLGARIDRVEANLTRQIDAIDKRLDAIEIEQLPARVAKLERTIAVR